MLSVAVISDTHSKHSWLHIPPVDLLIHTGDFTDAGTKAEALDFLSWFSQQPSKYKILIAGNHDFCMDSPSAEKIKAEIPSNIIYLNDELAVIEGIRIWGSPIQPTFLNMAFNRERGKDIRLHWDLIPSDIDILLTHGPAYGILDHTKKGVQVGCKDLRKTIEEKRPRVHICGHIHEDYGNLWYKKMLFLNASSWQGWEGPKNPPLFFDISPKILYFGQQLPASEAGNVLQFA